MINCWYEAGALQLRRTLFAWHEPSFHGAFIAVVRRDDRWGLTVSPLAMLELFADSTALSEVQWCWEGQGAEIAKAAGPLRELLRQGWWRPDYEAWRSGRSGWRLEEGAVQPVREAAPSLAWLDDWASAAIDELIEQTPQMRELWLKMQQAYPLLAAEATKVKRSAKGGDRTSRPVEAADQAAKTRSGAVLIEDERDWLEAVGWWSVSRRLRAALRLLEPENDAGFWSLGLLLQPMQGGSPGLPLDPADPESMALLPSDWQEHWSEVERDLAKMARIAPVLAPERVLVAGTAVSEPDPSPHFLANRKWLLDDDAAWTFLSEQSGPLIEAGFSLFLPRWWEEIQRQSARLKVQTRSSAGSAADPLLGLDQLVQFDWKLAIGDIDLDEREFVDLVEKGRQLVRVRDRWIRLDLKRWRPLLASLRKTQKGLSLGQALQLYWGTPPSDWAQWLAPEEGQELSDEQGESKAPEGADFSGARNENGETTDGTDQVSLALKVELDGPLRQLADELTGTARLTPLAPPPSFQGSLRPYQQLGSAWLLFLRRFGLGGCLADDMGLGKTIQWIAYLLHVKEKEAPGRPSLLVCSTSVIGNWQKELARFAPSLRMHIHYGSNRYRGDAFRDLSAEADLVITTYTLAQMDQEDIASVAWDCLCLDEAQNIKNVYTKQSAAVRVFPARHRVALTGTPMENRLTELWSIMDFLNPGYLGGLTEFNRRFVQSIERKNDADALDRLQRLVRPFLLRREKGDPAIELELPEKLESKEYIQLTAEQASLYESVLQAAMEKIEESTGIARRGAILSTLTQLKQLCNHPTLLLKEGKASVLRGRSHKVERLVEMVEELRQEGERCLVFTQYVETGHLLKETLEAALGEEVLFLHGGTPASQREKMIERFQQSDPSPGKGCGVFLLSLKAGGTGLNLTAANHVFHVDRWWNPAVENQATDRAYRIGQSRNVHVHKFITLGTLEERIDEMIERKQGLSEEVIGGGEQWLTELSTSELRDIFALRRQWVD
ncbi:snf2 family helicase, putative [Heliomicrobium modesticaldum Ice1]|uniref:Snf2 family helicase, putative n=1 Tax=Heliobacterium modesticaldum (strain ATCC 51547 / Ice1) TaxID=498761 RepID=B0TD64_HELMI|nr:DEAD/DEAH box helicase [Heliomicrobium modesticaldum]ABZ84105.1 snf2 family helicase, putative [Heliomicrobium modesticaldum Ice1]